VYLKKHLTIKIDLLITQTQGLLEIRWNEYQKRSIFHHATEFTNPPGSFKIELSSLIVPSLYSSHAYMYKCVRDPFSLSHPSQLCIIRELPTTILRRPIADPKIHAEWQTIGRARGRRLTSSHNGRHYRCNDLSSPSRFSILSHVLAGLKMPALLPPAFIRTAEKLILKRVF